MAVKRWAIVGIFFWSTGLGVGYWLGLSNDDGGAAAGLEANPSALVSASSEVADLARAQFQVRRLEAEVLHLQSLLDKEKTPDASVSVDASLESRASVKNDDEVEGQRQQRIERSMDLHRQRFENEQKVQMLSLRTHLQLTPEQESALGAFLNEQNELHLRLRRLQMEGRSNSPERSEIQQALSHLSLEQFAQTLLSADQQERFEELQSATEVARVETRASRMLSQVSPLLNLSETQKDQLYALYYEQIRSGQSMSATMGEEGELDMDTYMNASINAVKPFLSPEQLQIYRNHLEMQRENYRSYRQRF